LHDACDVESSALDEATTKPWTVVHMQQDWDHVFPLDHPMR